MRSSLTTPVDTTAYDRACKRYANPREMAQAVAKQERHGPPRTTGFSDTKRSPAHDGGVGKLVSGERSPAHDAAAGKLVSEKSRSAHDGADQLDDVCDAKFRAKLRLLQTELAAHTEKRKPPRLEKVLGERGGLEQLLRRRRRTAKAERECGGTPRKRGGTYDSTVAGRFRSTVVALHKEILKKFTFEKKNSRRDFLTEKDLREALSWCNNVLLQLESFLEVDLLAGAGSEDYAVTK